MFEKLSGDYLPFLFRCFLVGRQDHKIPGLENLRCEEAVFDRLNPTFQHQVTSL